MSETTVDVSVLNNNRNPRTLKDFVRERGGELTPGIVDWVMQNPSEPRDVISRLEFVHRLLSYLGVFDEPASFNFSIEKWREGVYDIRTHLLSSSIAVSRVQMIKAAGIKIVNMREDSYHDESTLRNDSRDILSAWFKWIIYDPEVPGTMHFQMHYAQNSSWDEKIIYLLDEEGDETYTYCHYCGEWRYEPYGHDDYINAGDVSDNWFVCANCRDDFYYCERCDRYVYDDDWDCDYECCCSCADEIRDEEEEENCSHRLVDTGHNLFFCDNGGDDESKEHYSFELEEGRCDDYDDYDYIINETYRLGEVMRTPTSTSPIHLFHYKSDCSIHGRYTVEVNTQPFTFEWFKSNEEVFNGLVRQFDRCFYTGTEANAGLHFHVDGKFFTNKMMYVVGTFLYKNYNFVKKVSGREEWNLNKWAARDTFDGETWETTLSYWRSRGSRYYAMNLLALRSHNTVEFRFFNGTNNPVLLKARLEIIHAIVNLAKVWDNVETPMRPKNLLRYMKKYGYSEIAVEEVRKAMN